MKGGDRNLKDDIEKMEKSLVDLIISNIENLQIDINIVESKVVSQGKFKKYIETNPSLQIRYEIHFLEESLSLDPIDKKIIYRNDKIGHDSIEISDTFYLKIRMAIIARKKYFEMISKRKMLQQILN